MTKFSSEFKVVELSIRFYKRAHGDLVPHHGSCSLSTMSLIKLVVKKLNQNEQVA